mmetsp:Transcript_5221/g.8626  ORF Transcript_5221/g.8626 Transcript_5221/m.8626 type:complete len:367 (+) Transcript_5221:78-1178(+)
MSINFAVALDGWQDSVLMNSMAGSLPILGFWCCCIFSVMMFLWSFTYFSCSTVPSLCRHNYIKSSCSAIVDSSSCCSLTTYVFDIIAICTDIAVALMVTLNISMASNVMLWRVFGQIAVGVSIFGVVWLCVKLVVLSRLYAYVTAWKDTIYNVNQHLIGVQLNGSLDRHTNRVSMKRIQHKQAQIRVFHQHHYMLDLFGAAAQDAVMAAVIFYVYADLQHDVISTSFAEWTVFDWLLRIKLALCVLLMCCKLSRVMLLECRCRDHLLCTMTQHSSVKLWAARGNGFDSDSEVYNEDLAQFTRRWQANQDSSLDSDAPLQTRVMLSVAHGVHGHSDVDAQTQVDNEAGDEVQQLLPDLDDEERCKLS